jgi:hypothetical protein
MKLEDLANTPESDESERVMTASFGGRITGCVSTAFARKLEQERDAARASCRLALNAFERNDAIDWADVEKNASPKI